LFCNKEYQKHHRIFYWPLRTHYFFATVEQMPQRSSLGEFELMILLGVIRLGEEAYGVSISRELEQAAGRDVALGSVYAALERLEQKGLVTSLLGDSTPARGGRAKKFFRATSKGIKEAKSMQRALINLWSGIPQLQGGRS
jgi:PadR family transcriptional regulator, regulatory protein PadR